MTYLFEWINKDENIGHPDGRAAKARQQVGIVNNEVVFTEINAKVNTTRRDPGKVKEPIYDDVQKWVDDWKESAPAEL